MKQSGQINNVNSAAASFRQALVDVLVHKVTRAAREFGVNQILLSGGITAKRLLRSDITSKSVVPVSIPSPALCTDNAAMVAACGYFQAGRRAPDGLNLDARPSLRKV